MITLNDDFPFNDQLAFMGYENLNWLEPIFENNIYQKLSSFLESEDEPFDLLPSDSEFYCNADVIRMDQNEPSWTVVLNYGESKLQFLTPQYKIFVSIVKENDQYKCVLNRAFLRDKEYPLKAIPMSLQRAFDVNLFN